MRLLLRFWIPVIAINSGMTAYTLLSGHTSWSMAEGFILSSSVVACAFTYKHRPPRVWRLDRSRVRELTDRELSLVEATLYVYDGEHRVFPSQLAAGLPEDWWDGTQKLPLLTPGLEALERVYRSGLLRDKRNSRRDDWPAFAPTKGAVQALATEQERRLQVAPVGPRSRPGALSA